MARRGQLCKDCGRPGCRLDSTCYALDARCYRCGKQGHYARCCEGKYETVRQVQETAVPGRRDKRGREDLIDLEELGRRFDWLHNKVGELAHKNHKLKENMMEYVEKIVKKMQKKDETIEEASRQRDRLENRISNLKYEVGQLRAENKKKMKQIKTLEREVGDLWKAKIDYEEEEEEEGYESNEAKSEEAEEGEEGEGAEEGDETGEEGRAERIRKLRAEQKTLKKDLWERGAAEAAAEDGEDEGSEGEEIDG